MFPPLIDKCAFPRSVSNNFASVSQISTGVRVRKIRGEIAATLGGGREWNREREGRGSRTRWKKRKDKVEKEEEEEEDSHGGITEATKKTRSAI